MPATHEVISAFVDNEPFDAQELATALADPAGRELLLDLLALGQIVQPEKAPALLPIRRPAPVGRRLLMAAAMVLALAGSYLIGHYAAISQSPSTIDARSSEAAPQPTRVIDLKPGINWHETSGGQ